MKVLAVLLMAIMAGAGSARELLQSDANCNAFAALQIKVINGKCWGASGATCSAVSSSTSAYQEAFDDWYQGDWANNCCISGRAEAAAEAIATAVAKVYTDAYTNVQCEVSAKGAGRACGWSQANGDAWATATAQAIASASADADGRAFCLSDIQAISQVVVDVAAKALADGCAVDDSSSFTYSQSFKEAIRTGIAKAFASAVASACRGGSSADASAQCFGDASSEGQGSTSGDGGAGYATQGDVAPCHGDIVTKCCKSTYKFDSCRCDSCYGRMTRTSDYENSVGQLRTWAGDAANGGTKCVCA